MKKKQKELMRQKEMDDMHAGRLRRCSIAILTSVTEVRALREENARLQETVQTQTATIFQLQVYIQQQQPKLQNV